PGFPSRPIFVRRSVVFPLSARIGRHVEIEASQSQGLRSLCAKFATYELCPDSRERGSGEARLKPDCFGIYLSRPLTSSFFHQSRIVEGIPDNVECPAAYLGGATPAGSVQTSTVRPGSVLALVSMRCGSMPLDLVR